MREQQAAIGHERIFRATFQPSASGWERTTGVGYSQAAADPKRSTKNRTHLESSMDFGEPKSGNTRLHAMKPHRCYVTFVTSL